MAGVSTRPEARPSSAISAILETRHLDAEPGKTPRGGRSSHLTGPAPGGAWGSHPARCPDAYPLGTVICFSIDPATGQPHLVHGMVTVFEVA